MGKYSPEDLRELIEYISSKPAIPFPSLTKEEREALEKDVIEQYNELKEKEENPSLVLDLVQKGLKRLKGQ